MTKGQLVRIIHVAKGKLRLDDDTYRQLLSTVTGKTSARDMTVPQLNNVLDAMKKCGFKIQPAKKTDSTRPFDDSPQSKKIRALWLEMADMGMVRDRTEMALAGWVKRETGVDSLQWLDSEQASSLIEKLKKWQYRARRLA